MDLFKEIKNLGFSADKYVIVGGASMMARGIKKTADIDIVATPDLFEYCAQNGWEKHIKPNGGFGLHKGPVEIYIDVNCGNFNPTFEELKRRSQIINGAPFCSIDDVLRYKKEYNREKDIKDIKLINDYLSKNTK